MAASHYLDKLAVSSEPGLTNAQLMLTNDDLRPVEPERRKWGSWNFVAFWVADSANINTWMIASSMITSSATGTITLAWWQAWICVWVGYFIAGCLICATGRIGAQYHISFPVVSRASFGIWGSLWPVFNRAAMACIWYGVQSWIGGECVSVMIEAIWPSYANIPNHIPSSGTTTKDFVSFFIFWFCSLPAIWFPVHKIRHLFTAKSIFTPIAMIAFFAWCIRRANGIGPIIHQPSTLHGSALAWAVIKGIMSSIANFATLIVNDPDFSRFAKTPKSALWSQLISIPFGFAITSFIGIIASSSSTVIFGTTIWNPLELLSQFLVGASSGERFGIFVIASGFTLAQLGTNIAANSVSAGTDMTALLPRFLNIRRGGYICALVGLVMCPWNLVNTSNNFTTYLSAYSVFLSSIAAVLLCDYYVVRKGNLDVKELYSARKRSTYFYTYGISWRGFVAYISGILINIVGFAGAVGRTVPIGAQYIYNVNYFAGFIVSAVIYYALCRLFPIPGMSNTWSEVDVDVDNLTVAYGQEVFDEEGRSIPEYEEALRDNKKDKSSGYATF
ncbi:putative uridine permease Fui1 [Talaromyces proteolyticus]|uniref:Uridine permease Fui1 n=1 Tax=Talaromyces proteolyticus TaxID=1131652 RepID=A0AAD4KQX1_9EURO|nr:putative uridine permease Fui1 [Talaromyces proteolyticus]KAH8698465.1 putative uridine permease Fui1 [Talaromyces proteolyticus]